MRRWLLGNGRCTSTTVPFSAVLVGLNHCRSAGRADTTVRTVEIGVTVADDAVNGGFSANPSPKPRATLNTNLSQVTKAWSSQ
jgi:hypothetical protein